MPAEEGSIRKTRFLEVQSLSSRISPKQWIHGSSRALQALRNVHGFCVTGGLPPIASEPTPSPRLWTTPPGATPAKLCTSAHCRLCPPDPSTPSRWRTHRRPGVRAVTNFAQTINALIRIDTDNRVGHRRAAESGDAQIGNLKLRRIGSFINVLKRALEGLIRPERHRRRGAWHLEERGACQPLGAHAKTSHRAAFYRSSTEVLSGLVREARVGAPRGSV